MNISIFKLTSLLFASSMLWAQSSEEIERLKARKANLRDEIKAAEMKIAENDSLQNAETKRFEMLRDRYQKDLETKKEDISSLGDRLKKIQREMNVEQAKQNSFKSGVEEIRSKREFYRKKLAEFCANLESAMSISLPWDREKRVARVAALRRDLETGSASAEEGVGRLNALLAEEIRFGDEIALQSRPISRNDGSLVNAQVLRIGNQWMVYMDDEKRSYGILVREGAGKFSWKEELSFAERELVRTALEVKGAKKPPQIVSLPLQIQMEGK